jgi:hypothetical protein
MAAHGLACFHSRDTHHSLFMCQNWSLGLRKLHAVLTYGAPICAQPDRDSHISTKLKAPWRDMLGSCG